MTTDLRRTTWWNGGQTWSGTPCSDCGMPAWECRAIDWRCCGACFGSKHIAHDFRQEIPVPKAKTTEELAEQALQPAEDKDSRLPDPELEAIKAILDVLTPFDYFAQTRVLDYCRDRAKDPGAPVPPWTQALQAPGPW